MFWGTRLVLRVLRVNEGFRGLRCYPSCLPGVSLVPPRLSKWSFPASLVPPWCLPGCPINPFPAFLVPRRLSNWSFPASLVPPWCLAGCPIGPFLPPWCLPGCPNGHVLPPWCLPGASFLPPWCLSGASQAIQMVLSCLPGASQAVQLVRVPVLDRRRILSKFEYNFNGQRPGSRQILGWAPRPAARSTGWPLKGRSLVGPTSRVPPWCLAGCPNGPFLPPWCLPRASQAVQLVRVPILDGRRILFTF